jgi:hypothetical protein
MAGEERELVSAIGPQALETQAMPVAMPAGPSHGDQVNTARESPLYRLLRGDVACQAGLAEAAGPVRADRDRDSGAAAPPPSASAYRLALLACAHRTSVNYRYGPLPEYAERTLVLLRGSSWRGQAVGLSR